MLIRIKQIQTQSEKFYNVLILNSLILSIDSHLLKTIFLSKTLRMLTGKKHPKIKLDRLRKVINMDIGVAGTSNQQIIRIF